MKAENLSKLAEPFPQRDIHWRAQTVRNGKALALAYLDARDVMDRLDAVCGPAGWQTRHRDCGNGRLCCEIGILVEGEWIWKSDGAGATDVEADKGAFSDSFKRAAVPWGVGRYLYDLGNTWVPCELGQNGKFKRFTEDPWKFVRGAIPTPPPKPAEKPAWRGPLIKTKLQEEMRELSRRMNGNALGTTGDLEAVQEEYAAVIEQSKIDLPDWYAGYDETRKRLQATLMVGPANADADDPKTYATE